MPKASKGNLSVWFNLFRHTVCYMTWIWNMLEYVWLNLIMRRLSLSECQTHKVIIPRQSPFSRTWKTKTQSAKRPKTVTDVTDVTDAKPPRTTQTKITKITKPPRKRSTRPPDVHLTSSHRPPALAVSGVVSHGSHGSVSLSPNAAPYGGPYDGNRFHALHVISALINLDRPLESA